MNLSLELKRLFEELDRAGIDYFLLTNFEPGDQVLGDTDLYVPLGNKEKFLGVLKKENWLSRLEPANSPVHSFFYKALPGRLFCLDVKYELKFGRDEKTWELKKGFEPAEHAANDNGLRRFEGLASILIYLAHLIFEKKQIQEKHLARLESYFSLFEKEIKPSEQEVFNRLKNLARGKKWEQIAKDFFVKTDLGPAIFPKKRFGLGYCVFVLGTDGSGKTSLIKQLQEQINFKCANLYLGENGWAFDFIGDFYKRNSGIFLRFLTNYFLYPFDLFVRTSKIKRSGRYRIVFVDRMPGFPFLSGRILASIYRLAMPRADLAVLLEGDPEIIWQRKKEGSVERLKKDLLKWDRVFSSLLGKKIRIDSVDNNVLQVSAIVADEIFSDPEFKKRLFREF